MASFSREYEVTEDMIEPVYKHVHHATTLRLLEQARLDFLAERGFPTEYFLEQQQFLVIARIEIEYKRELFAGAIRIECDEVAVEGKKIIINQTIYNHRDKLAISAMVESALMNGRTKRAMVLPDDFAVAVRGR